MAPAPASITTMGITHKLWVSIKVIYKHVTKLMKKTAEKDISPYGRWFHELTRKNINTLRKGNYKSNPNNPKYSEIIHKKWNLNLGRKGRVGTHRLRALTMVVNQRKRSRKKGCSGSLVVKSTCCTGKGPWVWVLTSMG